MQRCDDCTAICAMSCDPARELGLAVRIKRVERFVEQPEWPVLQGKTGKRGAAFLSG